MQDTSHIPGIHATSFTVLGGNGFGDLEVLATDPLGWVQGEIAKRNNTPATESVGVQTTNAPESSGASTPSTSNSMDLTGSFKEWLSSSLKGVVVAGSLLLLGVLLVVLGAYQITKD